MEIKSSDISGDLPWCIVLLRLGSGRNTETNFIILKQNKNNPIIIIIIAIKILRILERNSVAFLISAVISRFISCVDTSSSGQPSRSCSMFVLWYFTLDPLPAIPGTEIPWTEQCLLPVVEPAEGMMPSFKGVGRGGCSQTLALWAETDEKLGGRQGLLFFWCVFCHPLIYQTQVGFVWKSHCVEIVSAFSQPLIPPLCSASSRLLLQFSLVG